jgi:preprotein translocase subunit SecD
VNSLRWRIVSLAGTILVLGYFAAASFIPAATRKASAWIPDQGIRLGLDLQGGIHWVLGPDLEVAVEHELDVMRGSILEALSDKKVTPKRLVVENGQLVGEAASPEDAKALREAADKTKTLEVAKEDGNTIAFRLTPRWQAEVRKRGVEQSLEVVRRRVDDPIQGVPESVVTRQGDDRVLVQIPGGQLDREQARKLLRQTGFLEFKLVKDFAPTEELLRKKYENGLPPDTVIALEKEKDTDRVLGAFLVSKSADMTGEGLTDARSAMDPRYGWVVTFQFNSTGAQKFGKLSGDNIGKQLAIILDGVVASAPKLNSRISSNGQIQGHFDSKSAADLAVILRAGSLPIPMKIEEERTLGPALGADSIRNGIRAGLVGSLLVITFACWYYRLAGVYATVALLCNFVMLMGIMALSGATLTMPGIAGLVLTIGTAIDGTVIIYERIREELRLGKLPRAAIRTGFDKALWTILDANITNLITAVVLYEYGTGPIKGFAVTLSIGLVTSVFTALVVPRLLFEVYPGNRPVQSLSI